MSDLAARLAEKRERTKQQPAKKVSEVFGSQQDLMATLGIYLPKKTIAELKRLAFDEETSASKIIEELLAPRLKAGPRQKQVEPEYPTLD